MDPVKTWLNVFHLTVRSPMFKLAPLSNMSLSTDDYHSDTYRDQTQAKLKALMLYINIENAEQQL